MASRSSGDRIPQKGLDCRRRRVFSSALTNSCRIRSNGQLERISCHSRRTGGIAPGRCASQRSSVFRARPRSDGSAWSLAATWRSSARLRSSIHSCDRMFREIKPSIRNTQSAVSLAAHLFACLRGLLLYLPQIKPWRSLVSWNDPGERIQAKITASGMISLALALKAQNVRPGAESGPAPRATG